VGVVATFTIQARDTYGNLREKGGDMFDITLTHDGPGTGNEDVGTQSNVQHKGVLEDKGDGTYVVTYTLQLEGYYNVEVRLGEQLILTAGTYTVPVIRAVHWDFYAPTSLAHGPGLSNAIDHFQQ
jgi:hypothetical protein